MEQFSLTEYLKNPIRPIVTRDGRRVRIICTDRNHKEYPIVALVQTDYVESVWCYAKDGINNGIYIRNTPSSRDLFFAPEPKTKKVGWINLYKDADGDPASGDLYETKEEALVHRSTGLTYLGTSKVEWEKQIMATLKPIDFKLANLKLYGCKIPLPVFTDGIQCVSCWKCSFLDRLKILFTGRIWASVRSGSTQPPMWIAADYPFVEDSERK